MFKRILVANRGEIALRVIRAATALGIETVAVFSEADADSPHLKFATRAVCIGPGPSRDSYLNQNAVLQAALQYECQALHPGYGFLAENAEFAARCAQQKTTFIGPSPRILRAMGDKITARQTMAELGIHGVPGSKENLRSVEEAQATAEEIGYPVMLKATAGGGGKGMRVCRDPQSLARGYASARMEAEKAFGNPDVYLERFVEGGRHIEFQMLGDRYGHVIHLGERECSTQRSNQKLVEEAPSPCISEEERLRTGARLAEALSQLGYEGAGTVEFLRTPQGELFFMEMNTRLQVEHPVTELITGIDLVEWQIRIAAGEPLSIEQDAVSWKGHAIECRINAEDPAHGFRPSPGTISKFAAEESWRYSLEGPVRLDSHVEPGYRIPTLYDSMVAKLVVAAEDRESAVARMGAALEQFQIEGVETTRPLHMAIMQDEAFCSGDYDTPRMAKMMESWASKQREDSSDTAESGV